MIGEKVENLIVWLLGMEKFGKLPGRLDILFRGYYDW